MATYRWSILSLCLYLSLSSAQLPEQTGTDAEKDKREPPRSQDAYPFSATRIKDTARFSSYYNPGAGQQNPFTYSQGHQYPYNSLQTGSENWKQGSFGYANPYFNQNKSGYTGEDHDAYQEEGKSNFQPHSNPNAAQGHFGNTQLNSYGYNPQAHHDYLHQNSAYKPYQTYPGYKPSYPGYKQTNGPTYSGQNYAGVQQQRRQDFFQQYDNGYKQQNQATHPQNSFGYQQQKPGYSQVSNFGYQQQKPGYSVGNFGYQQHRGPYQSGTGYQQNPFGYTQHSNYGYA